ncbi:hypothetical protein [Campylobacter porcelli]|uniref:Putative membrane protein n=1 Tax=Campylobacter porcelli TaxID=1660073 RepID=A0A1X9SVJ5_9BACT|nr:hypothetical protein [Campylobacter sp. RM6137]ARR00298.1 putative membrane protein [Campylobacter sp. RM6137]
MLSDINPHLDKKHLIIKDVLCSLSKQNALRDKSGQFRLNGNIDKLKEVYVSSTDNASEDFRHKYSKIFLILSRIDREKNELSIDNLMEAIEEARAYIEDESNGYSTNFVNKFLKLYDHVVLEILQIKYMREIENKGENNNSETIKKLKEAQILAENASNSASKATKKINDMQKEYITILGIFASIVFAFVAGLTFSTSVLSNIHQASVYRLSFIVCLIGLFITNILHYLYAFIREIHFSKINQDFEKQKECAISLKSLKNGFCNSYIFRFNLLITCIMCAIFIYWRFFDMNTKNYIDQNTSKIHQRTEGNSTAGKGNDSIVEPNINKNNSNTQ